MPSPPVGFALLTHANSPQLLRLVGRLDALYGGPPIVGHHDFSKSALDERAFAGRVEFVRPHVVTRWATFTLVEATVRAVRRLLERPDAPDWIVLLSGADYPVRPAAAVVADLRAGGADAYIDHRPVDAALLDRTEWGPPPERGYLPGQGPHNGPLSVRRYIGQNLRLPWVERVGGRLRYRPWHQGVHRGLYVRGLSERLSPFHGGVRCYVGSQWFTLGRRAAEYLVRFHERPSAIRRHYAWGVVPDESYVQTVLGNAPGLRLDPDSRRFIDWSAALAPQAHAAQLALGQHPAALTLDHLPAIERSGAHFARKVDPARSGALMAHLDARLGAA